MMTESERAMAAQKAKARRYKKPLLKDLNMETIRETLQDIAEASTDIQWMEQDDLLSQMLGDDDDASEFKISFGLLAGDAYQMEEELQDDYLVPEFFDLWFAAMGGGEMLGYDEYEGDYYSLERFDEELAQQESRKKLERMTKKEIIDMASQCFKIATDYLSIKNRYEDLRAALDILRGKNSGQLKVAMEIDELYEKMWENGYLQYDIERRFDRMVSEVHPAIWVQ